MSDGFDPTNIDLAGLVESQLGDEEEQSAPKTIGERHPGSVGPSRTRYPNEDPVLQGWYVKAIQSRERRNRFKLTTSSAMLGNTEVPSTAWNYGPEPVQREELPVLSSLGLPNPRYESNTPLETVDGFFNSLLDETRLQLQDEISAEAINKLHEVHRASVLGQYEEYLEKSEEEFKRLAEEVGPEAASKMQKGFGLTSLTTHTSSGRPIASLVNNPFLTEEQYRYDYESQWRPENLGPHGRPMNRLGEELPIGAYLWDSNNQPYFGEGNVADGTQFRRFMSHFWTAAEARKENFGLEEDAPWYQQWWARNFGEYGRTTTAGKGLWALTGFIFRPLIETLSKESARGFAATSLAVDQELAELGYDPFYKNKEVDPYAEYIPMYMNPEGSVEYTGDPEMDYAIHAELNRRIEKYGDINHFDPNAGLKPFLRIINPVKIIRDSVILGYEQIRGRADDTWEFRERRQELMDVARMGFSIGENDNHIINEFEYRVHNGELPSLVAQDMANPISQMAAEMLFDALNLLDLGLGKVFKGSRLATNIAQSGTQSNRILDAAQIARTANTAEVGAALTEAAIKSSDEFIDAVTAVSQATAKGIGGRLTDKKFLGGLFTRTVDGLRNKAMTNVDSFARILLVEIKDPDTIAKVTRLYADIGSGNRDAVAAALVE